MTPTSTTSQTDGIYSMDNTGLLIEDCTITIANGDTTGHSDGWQSWQDTSVTFRRNVVSHPNGGADNHGLWVQNVRTGGTANVYNNVVTRSATNTTFAISSNRIAAAGTGFDGKALIYNNTIYNGNYGLEINECPLSEAKNNIIYFAPGGTGIRILGSSLPAGRRWRTRTTV